MTATRTESPRPTAIGYEPVPKWAARDFDGDATSVAVDSADNVYVFNRGPVPMVVFDRHGKLLATWGEGEFDKPHSICVDEHDDLFLVDMGGRFVEKRTRDGEVLLRIDGDGEPNLVQPTDIAVGADGAFYVADARGGVRLHKFDPDGKLIVSWGGSGSDPGQFSIPHGVCMSDNGETVTVCDRENFRLQKFHVEGGFLEQRHFHRPSAARTQGEYLYVAEQGPPPFQHGMPGLGCRVSVVDSAGEVVARFGADVPGLEDDRLLMPHSIDVDSRGDVYIAECSRKYLSVVLGQTDIPDDIVTLRKWRRVAEAS